MYVQVRAFDPNKMGKRKGYCLQNDREGFGIEKGTFASAKADMESQRKNGTLHSYDTLPNNVSVPVYIDTTSKYEHVKVHMANGEWWEDGKKSTAPKPSSVFGWGELCDGVRVVEFKPDEQPKPQPSSDTKPVDQSVVLAVIRGDYGNGTDRIYRLKEAGYEPNEVQREVNNYLRNTAQPKYYTVQAGDNLTRIAQKFGTTVDKLVSLNSIPNKDLIYIGQKLRVA